MHSLKWIRVSRGLRDSALIRLMSDCLLRVSEAVAVNLEDLKDKTLTGANRPRRTRRALGETALCHKRYAKDCSIAICAKAGWHRQGVRCSVRVVRGRSCPSVVGLTARSARRQIIYWSELAGVEGFISGHSLRVGSAVSLAKAGASVVDMQVAGRWKSSQMPAHYAKAELAERGAIARFKEKRGGG